MPSPRTAPLLAALALVGGLLLAGCGDDSNTASNTASDTASDTASTGPDSTSSSPTGGASCTYQADGQPAAKDVEPPPSQPALTGTVSADMKTSVGDLHLSLDADSAPCTVNSFVSLAKQGYFDQTACHRLTTPQTGISVLQCGDPTGTGRGGPGYSFPDELTGQERYPAGTLAMANAGPNTNGSQFFIVYGKTPLPAAYTVFGSVDRAGVRIVSTVAKAGTDNANGPGDGHPTKPVNIDSVTVD